MSKLRILLIPTVLALLGGMSAGRDADLPSLEERSKWFREDRFGLFIHWGVYSMIGKGEWVQDTGRIPVEEYQKYYKEFNPSQFNAAEWVALAKRAGQKYLVITTKHHDGFCMFDSKLTDYDILNTPVKRDVIKELADECHRQGMILGFYYSIMDWHHPDYVPRRPWEKNRSTDGADFNRYCEYMKGQLRELMTNYGRIDVLWFDGGWEHTKPEDLAKFKEIIAMARELQPQMLVNNRASIGGDFTTPEQYIPATGVVDEQGRPTLWEVCMTMTTGHGAFAPTAWWGYDRYETVFKPTEELVQKLIDVNSKGGNFLLNIGPEPTGKIRPEEAERLEGVGRWMAKYGEAIYGSSPSPFRRLPFFGRVTQKADRLFVHVFDWPQDRRLVLPGLKNPVVRAHMMGNEQAPVGVSRQQGELGEEVVLALPAEPTDKIASVIVVELTGKPEVAPLVIRPNVQGVVKLPAAFAEILAQHGQRAKPVSQAGRTYIGNWSNPSDVATWEFTMPAAGKYAVELDARLASDKAPGQRIVISVGKQELTTKIASDGVKFTGRLKIPAGDQKLSVKLPDAKRT
ncbi:MAG: alpha-L-fucosidase, partial [Thermoguttaceae bacterium]